MEQMPSSQEFSCYSFFDGNGSGSVNRYGQERRMEPSKNKERPVGRSLRKGSQAFFFKFRRTVGTPYCIDRNRSVTERTDLRRWRCRFLFLLLPFPYLVNEPHNHKDDKRKDQEIYDCVDEKADVQSCGTCFLLPESCSFLRRD